LRDDLIAARSKAVLTMITIGEWSTFHRTLLILLSQKAAAD